MESTIKHCIINASDGSRWYPKGSDRLMKSLNYHGSTAAFIRSDWWPDGKQYDKTCPYNIKAAMFELAIMQGYTHLIWLDCSAWCIKDPMPFWDRVNENGYYFWQSGYNCAQVCSDRCLQYFGITRDQAELMPDVSTSSFGINLLNPSGRLFAEKWIQAAKDGMFIGSRHHDGQSTDPRFLFHRQDQSCASIIVNQLGLESAPPNDLTCYYEPGTMKESVIFALRGM